MRSYHKTTAPFRSYQCFTSYLHACCTTDCYPFSISDKAQIKQAFGRTDQQRTICSRLRSCRKQLTSGRFQCGPRLLILRRPSTASHIVEYGTHYNNKVLTKDTSNYFAACTEGRRRVYARIVQAPHLRFNEAPNRAIRLARFCSTACRNTCWDE